MLIFSVHSTFLNNVIFLYAHVLQRHTYDVLSAFIAS